MTPGRWAATPRAWWRTVLGHAPDRGRPGVLRRLTDAQRDLVTGLVAVACGGGGSGPDETGPDGPAPDVQSAGRRRQQELHRSTARLVAAQSSGWAEVWARAAQRPS